MSGGGFIFPQVLWGLLALVPLVALWSWISSRREDVVARFVVRENWPLLNRTVSKSARFHRSVLIIIALSASIVAAARPWWGSRERHLSSRGVNVVFAIDVSKSMAAADILPNRLEAAKRIVRQVLPEIHGNCVGIMPFAGEAFLQCPLTSDFSIAQDVLQKLDFGAVSYQGTDIPQLLNTAESIFLRSGAGSRALVIITDGEDHSDALAEAVERAAKENIRIYALGIGTPAGAPLRMPDGSYIEDSEGHKINSKLNTEVLKELADKTGGSAYIAGETGNLDVGPLINDLQGLAKGDLGEMKRVVHEERYQWPLALAILCLLIEPLIRERRSDSIRKSRPAQEKKGAASA
ncbi:VWA domain-containing protein [Candidatus Sumerlaeota bacterium]|nr:VWA domain-containing protein [Candidatus Sumerlaeota bacterium]